LLINLAILLLDFALLVDKSGIRTLAMSVGNIKSLGRLASVRRMNALPIRTRTT
jgi:hypothetical protein